jgi:hypothetical protein
MLISARRIVRVGSGPVSNHFKTIPVRDERGDQLTLYEIRDRMGPFRLLVRKRLTLCTGEAVRSLGGGRFIIEGTGEQLTRL